MFLTVTLNAAIDKTLRVANLQIGRRHRCAPGELQAGGKGINVARALRALGQPVVATGLAGGRAGDMIVEDLAAGGIVHQFVRIADESRSSTIVLDPAGTHVATEIVEYGPESCARTSSSRSARPTATCWAAARPSCWPAASPATCPRTGTRLRCARLAGSASTRCSTPRASRCGWAWAASPISSCPTRWRPRSSSASSSRPTQDLVVALEQIVEMGARGVVITRDDGALAYVREAGRPRFLRATVPQLEVVSPVGAGRCAAGGPAGRAARGAPVRRGAALRRRLRCREHAARAARHARSRARCSASRRSSRSPSSRPRRPDRPRGGADPVASIG